MNRSFFRFLIKLLTSVAIGLIFIWWTFNSIDIQELRTLSSKVNPYWILFGMIFYALAILCRIFRWHNLLLFFESISLPQVARAFVVGHAMNILLPARLGELFRINICKSWYSIPRSTALTTILLERTSDGILVLLYLIIGMAFLTHIQDELFSLLISGSCIFGMVLLGLFFLRKTPIAFLFNRFPFLKSRVASFQKTMQGLPAKALYKMVAVSILVWIFEGMSLWSMVQASGVTLNFFGASLLIGAVSLSTLLPSPPGFLGTMQFAFAMAVMGAGYPPTPGILAATITQVFLLGTLALLGSAIYCLIPLKRNHLKKV